MIDTSQSSQPAERQMRSSLVATQLRAEMPICQRFAYFDHAAVGPIPRAAASAMQRYASEACEQGDTPWLDWHQRTEMLRKHFAEMLHATTEEIALIPNTSTGIGQIAEGWRWQPGDSVIVPSNEFPSNLAPWRHLRRRGVVVREVPMPEGPNGTTELSLPRLLEAIDGSTRIVAVSWVGFLSGWRINVAEYCEAIHRRGALMFLDAIQGLGAFPLDVAACGVDFCAADGHKWMLGPEGAGMLYVRREHLDRLDPLMIGWHSLDDRAAFDPANTQLKTTAARYEGGSANMVGLLGLERSVDLLLGCGAHREGSGFADAILGNVQECQDRLVKQGFHVHLPDHPDNRSGILTISWDGANDQRDPIVVRKHLLTQGIVTSVRGGRLRVSTHAYNNSDDIQRLVTALRESL